MKVQVRQAFAYFNNNVDSKRHIIIRTAILCNEINSGQILKNTIYMFNYYYFFFFIYFFLFYFSHNCGHP